MFQGGETVSVSIREKHSSRYGRIPKDLLCDKRVSAEAVRIFGCLALWVFQGNVARRGMRELGDEVGLSAATVYRRIKELQTFGYLEIGDTVRGQRAFYVLNSMIFGKKQRAGVEELVSAPSGHRRLATVRVEKTA